MIGNYQNKMDDKNRLTIPSKFREELGKFIVISFGFDNTLEIRTKDSFNKWLEFLQGKGNLSNNARNLSRIILGNSFDVTIDKAGRILIPKSLMDLASIEKDVFLVGIGDKVEVHSEQQWNSLTSDPKKLTKTLEEMAEDLNK